MGNNSEVDQLIEQTAIIAAQTETTFGTLTDTQLNWKPGRDRWSIAQCFEHLLNTNKAYFPTFDSILSGQKRTRFIERLPVIPSIGGALLKKSLDPGNSRKLKAPQKVQPSNSNVDRSVLTDFEEQQKLIAEYMARMKNLGLDSIIVTSPFLSLITYSLMDAFRIIVVHEQRHFQQASNVAKDTAFP